MEGFTKDFWISVVLQFVYAYIWLILPLLGLYIGGGKERIFLKENLHQVRKAWKFPLLRS